MSHANWAYTPGDDWNERRAARKHRADVPFDDLAANKNKAVQLRSDRQKLRAEFERARPDVLVVFGDDQIEQFDFNNFPALSVYVGAEFEGRRIDDGEGGEQPDRAKNPGHPEVAVAMLTGLMRRGFDPAFSMDTPKPDRGMCHAVMRPAQTLGNLQIPIVPILVNHYYAPQPTAMRSYQLGKAVAETVAEMPGDLRIAVCGSGGMWHTPEADGAWLNEEFDNTLLDLLKVGNARGMAEFFDGYEVPEDDGSQLQYLTARSRNVTGLPSFGGPQGGTRESCSWIAAAAVVEGRPSEVIDYVPVYSSPIGLGFAYTPIED
jgi:3-O-methylgallate 3,4-dioxygenase